MVDYIGQYISILVGHSDDKKIREKGSSGGAVTSVLIKALQSKLIDAAITVSMSEKEPWKPIISLATSKKEIISSQGSKYTLISFKDILDQLEKNQNMNLAVVGLPCHISILRKMKKLGKYKNIKLLLGLFCGYNIPFEGTEFLIKNSGIKKEEIVSLEYRGGKYPGGFLVQSNKKKVLFPKEYYDIVNLMFVPKSCLRCQDYTNEKADISFGDTMGMYDNSSLIIVRTEIGKKLIKNSDLKTKPILKKRFVKLHGHNLRHKKKKDPIHQIFIMHFLKIFGKFIPFKVLGYLAKSRRRLIK